MPNKRYSDEMNQEEISRNQFKQLISKMGWMTSDIKPDIGEDILIRICRDGIPTGVSFQVQLKSVENIERKLLKDYKTISYRFETDSLQHWDVQLIPVYIVIWDITKNTGWHILVKDVIKALNNKSQNWSSQETIAVHIPINNQTNENGLNFIQSFLIKELGPIILKDKELVINIQLSFPQDEEGKVKYQEFKQFINSGNPVWLDGKYIEKWEVPDAWKRVYGELNLTPMFFQLGPGESKKKLPVQIELSSPKYGSEKIDYVEIYIIKHGQEEFTLSNEKQLIPYKIQLVVNIVKHSIVFTLTIDYSMLDGIEAKKAIHIKKILSNGGIITYKMLDNNSEVKIPFNGVPSASPNDMFVNFVNNIFKIQSATNIKLFLREDGVFIQEDYENAKEMVSILETGIYKNYDLSFTLELRRLGIQQVLDTRRKSERLSFKSVTHESYLEILGTRFELGPRVQYIKGLWLMPIEEIERWLKTSTDEDTLIIQIRDVELYEEFENWIKQ